MNEKIRIRLKAYDHRVLDQSVGEIVETGPAHRGSGCGTYSAAHPYRAIHGQPLAPCR